jgi:uncharacterized protein YaiL (DUF2058 family)
MKGKGSLQDQLLGAGLIKKQDANNIKTAKKKQVKKSIETKTELKNEAAELAEKARLAEQEKARALNAKRKQEAEEKAAQAQIKQMIKINDIAKIDKKAPVDSELVYNFTDGSKIKTMLVSAENHKLISKGVVAIAKSESANNGANQDDANYHLIPAVVARKIIERDSASIVLLNEFSKADDSANNTDDVDDPYAAYEVPDDLMW